MIEFSQSFLFVASTCSIFLGILLLSWYFFLKKKHQSLFFSHRYFSLSTLFLTLSVLCLIFSFFEPRLPFLQESFSEEGTETALVIDVSLSMLTRDIILKGQNYSRLDATKLAITRLLSEAKNNRYSLGIFSGEALRILPFSQDENLLVTFLSDISPQRVSKKGTNFSQALEAGLSSFITTSGGVIVLFSDGGDGDIGFQPELYKKKLQEKNIGLIIVGVGTEIGGNIPVGQDMFGRPFYKVYEGKKVISKLESSWLQKQANILGGKYISLSGENDIKDMMNYIKKYSKPMKTEKKGSAKSLVWYFIISSFLLFLLSLYFQTHNKKLGKK